MGVRGERCVQAVVVAFEVEVGGDVTSSVMHKGKRTSFFTWRVRCRSVNQGGERGGEERCTVPCEGFRLPCIRVFSTSNCSSCSPLSNCKCKRQPISD
jgi:hypothetical protein